MAYLLFFVYLLGLSWVATKINYFKASGLSAKWLAALFILKVAGGVLYGYIHARYVQGADTWSIYNWSLLHYDQLLHNPLKFITSWQGNGLGNSADINPQFSDIFGSDYSAWNYLKSVVLMKAEAILNLFSFGHYYVNVVLYSFITFAGYIAFYRGLLFFYPGSRITSLIAVFFIPSCFLWTSGMYKDGIVFMLFGFIIHNMAFISRQQNSVAPYIKIIICLAAIFILRNYIALTLAPCLLAVGLSIKYPSQKSLWFTGIFLAGVLLFFTAPFILPGLNIPQFLVNSRNEFLALPANSSLAVQKLQPTFLSYIKLFPEAINHGFLRPYIWENKGLFYAPFALELLAFYGLGLYYLIKRGKDSTGLQQAFFMFGAFLLASNWLLLGYTSPIIGALIRYKSIFMPFVVAHFLYFTLPQINTLRK